MMKLAISNIAWDDKADSYIIGELPGHGCSALEIAPTRIFPENPYDRLEEAREFAAKLKEETGFPICSMQSIWYRRTENIFGSSQEKEALIQYTKAAILFAEAIGCPNLVFGNPKNRTMPEGKRPEEAMDFFRTIGDYAADHGTAIALEAVPVSYGTNFLNLTSQVYDYVCAVDSPGLKINLDFGSLLINGEDVSQIASYIPRVNHVHISEQALAGIARREEHVVFAKALKAAGYDRYVSIEMRNQEDPEKVLSIVDYVGEILKGV